MVKTSKKIIALLLVVFTLFTAFPLQGVAAEVQQMTQARLAGANYCSTAAAEWAKAHWDDYDSVLLGTGYWYDGGDCANFVSQCLYMGGMDMSTYWNTNGYKCHWTAPHGKEYEGSYIRCVQLYNFLVKMGAQVIKNPSASQVSIGDVILYNNPSIGRLNHSAIVIDIKNGEPVLAAHSVNGIRYRTDDPYKEWHLNFSGNDTYLMKLNGSTCVNYNPRNFDVYTASSGDLRLYRDTSTSSGYYTTFLSGEYAHIYEKSADGQWGYTFRYGNWGWVRLSNFTYRTHITSAPVSHLFGDWFVVQTANCKQDGIDKHICKRCGYEETKTTKGGHIIDPKATCLEEGFCKICGAVCEAPLGHDWDAGTVTTQPTCTETGIKTFICKRDSSHTKTAVVPALGHNYVQISFEPQGCTNPGQQVMQCTRCSDTYTKDSDWSEWITAEEAPDGVDSLPASMVKTKTQYRIYSKRETKTSTKSTIDGWTCIGKEQTGWGPKQGPVTSDPSNGVRKVESEEYVASTTTHYKYYHRYGWGYNVDTGGYSYVYANDSQHPNADRHEIESTTKLSYYTTSAGNKCYKGPACSSCGATTRWMEDGTYTTNNYGTCWYYYEPVYTYTFERWVETTEEEEP